jgi:DNA-binding MarR family transcriptional regulator
MEMQRNVLNLMSKIRSKAFLQMEKDLEKFGILDISPSHGDVLFVVSKHQPIDMSELALHTGRDKSTLSQLVNGLIKNGYLSRTIPSSDRRKAEIRITQKAEGIAPILIKIGITLDKKMHAGLTATSKKKLIVTMQKILNNFE